MKSTNIDQKPQESEKLYHMLFDHSMDGIILTDPGDRGKILSANQAACRILGWSKEELIGKRIDALFDMEDPALSTLLDVPAHSGSARAQLTCRCKDGTTFPGEISTIFYIDDNGEPRTIAIIRDLTDLKKTQKDLQAAHEKIKKQSEELQVSYEKLQARYEELQETNMTLRESEVRLQVIVTNSPNIIFEQDRDLRYTWIHNPTSPFSASDVIGKTDTDLLPPDQAQQLEATKRRVLDTGCREQALLQLNLDGQPQWFEAIYKPYHNSAGKIIGIISYMRDVTKSKRTGEALQQSRDTLQAVLDAAPAGIVVAQPNGEILLASTGTQQILGCSVTGDAHGPEGGYKISMPDGSPVPAGQLPLSLALKGQTVSDIELLIKRDDGTQAVILASATPLQKNHEKQWGAIAVFQDITGRKVAEAKLKNTLDNLDKLVRERTTELEKAYNSLKESEKRLSEAQKMAHIGNWDWNLITGKVYWSDELYRIFGRSPQESGATYDEFLNYVHPDDRDIVDTAVKEAFNGEPGEGDYRIILANGEERIVHTYAEVTFNEKNTPIRMNGTVQDVTERKQAEKALRESESRFRDLFEAISSGVIVYDVINNGRDFIFKDINPAGERIDHVRREDVIGKSLYEIFPCVGEMGLDTAFRRVWHTGRPEFFPLAIYKDERITLWVTNYIYRLPSGELVAVFDDITERKKAEEALAMIETARKKEIHHRIKNNLQVISSLLDLQAEQFNNNMYIKDSEVLEAFRESQDRVISMALIHEELYKGGGFETLNFSPYIEELAKNLLKTYRVGNSDISLSMDLLENAFFDLDTAVPLGIIINELVSNSLKHAFKDRDSGEIQVKLHREQNTEYVKACEELKNGDCNVTFVLTVSDNGIGIPEDFNIEELESLGMQLVTTLAEQLEGKLELKRNNGTEFTMRFTVTENNDQVSALGLQ